MLFTVKYQYATYSGIIQVNAVDSEEAKTKAKNKILKQSFLPMAYLNLTITKTED